MAIVLIAMISIGFDGAGERLPIRALPRVVRTKRMGDGLRIAVMTGAVNLAGWQFLVLEEIVAGDDMQLVAIVQPAQPAAGRSRPRHHPAWSAVDKLEALLTHRLVGRRWKGVGRRYTVDDEVDVSTLDADMLFLQADERGVSRLRSLQIDVLLHFDPVVIPDDLRRVARYGVWSLLHEDGSEKRGGPAGFWEFYLAKTYTGACVFVRDGEDDRGVRVRRAVYPTYAYSWNENRRRLLWKSSFLLVDALRRLAKAGRIEEERAEPAPPFGLYDNRMYGEPRWSTALVAIGKILWRGMRSLFGRLLFDQQWQLLLCRGPLAGACLTQLERLTPPRGHFWADPFIVEREQHKWIYFEDYDFRTRKGAVSCGRLRRDGMGFDQFHDVLSLPYHLSYPFIFENDGDLFMIPETNQNRTIEIWKCTTFPNRWEMVRTIFDGISAVDTTLLEYQGRWWMFVNIDRYGLSTYDSELFIFHTDHPVFGAWSAHQGNPVVVDGRKARMGGGFIRTADDRLIRCAQLGGRGYGGGLLFLEVTTLTESAYEERLVEEIGPHWRKDASGLHHCHHLRDATVFDVCIRVPRAIHSR